MTAFPDFSGRDVSIRHLTYTPIRRRDGVPHALFDAYWRDVHGPLCARLPGLGFYAQHHLSRDLTANLWPMPDGVEPMDVVLDGMVEIGFADEVGQGRFQKASPLLFSDERNFIGHDVAYDMPNGARTLIDRDPDGTPNRDEPGHRIHIHLHGSGTSAIHTWSEGFAEALAGEADIVKVRLHMPETYRNSEPQPAAPEVDHSLPIERKRVVILELGWSSRIAAEAYLQGPRYAAQAKGLKAHVSSLGAFRVASQVVFIRDGVLTTAGLRGSRPASLIEALGAFNQVHDDVTRLFHALPPTP